MVLFFTLHFFTRILQRKLASFAAFYVLIGLVTACTTPAHTQSYSYYEDENKIQYDQIFKNNIRTVLFHRADVVNSYPVIMLHSSDKVTLQFDDLLGKNRDYQYTIVYCDANWQPSALLKTEFLDGLFTDYLTGFSFSTNTYKNYTHYRLDFPNANMKPKLSGNYILKIFIDNEKNPVITRRLYVYEPITTPSAQIGRPNFTKYIDRKQQVNFSVNIEGAKITDPYRDIKVVVKQNWRSDNEIRDLRPRFVQDRQLIYNYDEENLFDGGNEFRPFDIRDKNFKGMGVRFYTFDSLYNAVLFPDDDRSYSTYTAFQDQDGNYIISNRNGQANHTDGDYFWVYFQIKSAYKDDKQEVYVFGGLTNWQLDPRFKMQYNSRDGVYECRVLLKQGYYDYQYVTVDANGKIDATTLEGSHWETENNYTIFVYQRPPGQNYDKLIGYGRFNSIVK